MLLQFAWFCTYKTALITRKGNAHMHNPLVPSQVARRLADKRALIARQILLHLGSPLAVMDALQVSPTAAFVGERFVALWARIPHSLVDGLSVCPKVFGIVGCERTLAACVHSATAPATTTRL